MTGGQLTAMRQRPLWGLGLYWAWVALVFYSNALAPYGAKADTLVESIWLWATWSHMLTLVVIALVTSINRYAWGNAFLRCFGAWGCVATTALIPLIAAVQEEISTLLILALAAVIGIVSGWFIIQWAQVYGTARPTQLMVPTFLSFALGLALYFAITFFPTPLPTVTAVLLPLFSWFALKRCHQPDSDAAGEAVTDSMITGMITHTTSGTDVRTSPVTGTTPCSSASAYRPDPVRISPSELVLCIAAVFVFALCGELLRTLALQVAGASTNIMGTIYLLGGLIGLALLLVYALIPARDGLMRHINISMVRFVFVLMALAFLVAPFLGEWSAPIAYGIFGAGFWCFRAITWVFCLLIARALTISSLRAIAVLDATFALAVVVSGRVNNTLAEAMKMGTAEMTTVSLVAVFVCMLIAMVVLNGRGIRKVLDNSQSNPPAGSQPNSQLKSQPALSSQPAPSADSLSEKNVSAGFSDSSDSAVSSDAALTPEIEPDDSNLHDNKRNSPEDPVQALFDRCGLSPREREVATLLARGRSLPFIQEELYISAGTAQTHARHIYKKMGVHSRQELIDCVEHPETH